MGIKMLMEGCEVLVHKEVVGKSPEAQLFCVRYSHSKIIQFLCQISKGYHRLEVHFQLSILERTNHTSLKHLLTKKSFPDELKHHTDLVARVSLWLHVEPTGKPSPPPTQNRCISDNKVSPASAERRHNYSAASFTLTYLTGNPDCPSRMEAPIILSGNVKFQILHDANCKQASCVISRRNTGLCCAELCHQKVMLKS